VFTDRVYEKPPEYTLKAANPLGFNFAIEACEFLPEKKFPISLALPNFSSLLFW